MNKFIVTTFASAALAVSALLGSPAQADDRKDPKPAPQLFDVCKKVLVLNKIFFEFDGKPLDVVVKTDIGKVNDLHDTLWKDYGYDKRKVKIIDVDVAAVCVVEAEDVPLRFDDKDD